MIRINQIKLKPNHTKEDLENSIQKKLKIHQAVHYSIIKRSIDSRFKPDLLYIYSVDVTIPGYPKEQEERIVKKVHDNNVMLTKSEEYTFPLLSKDVLHKKIVIVGAGPAGLFCGLMLARAGLKPLILERGLDVDQRSQKVSDFWNGKELDLDCNVQFGEGGAGTFSDGKLNTQIKDPSGKIRKTLEIFVEFGAPQDILYDNKPHIGTDILRDVVRNIRNEIIRLGGEVRFQSKVTELSMDHRIHSVIVNHSETVECDLLVLALGHSARDTFEMLHRHSISMTPKPFAVGVRMEHPQAFIDDYAYGDNIYELPPASYKVTYLAKKEERGVYSFCMCPGGYVVNASSEAQRLCINGMSYSKRDSANANSAIVVTVNPSDYGSDSPLGGMYFQRSLEEAAYREGKGKIPCQTFKTFKNHETCDSFGTVQPCTKGDVTFADLHKILPEYVCDTIIKGVTHFARQIPGFDMDDAVLSAVESRTSSPVRIERNDELMSNIAGIYPCGEGAGYAGGITSAAVDGIRIAEAIANYKGV